jgi:hypothetical protein
MNAMTPERFLSQSCKQTREAALSLIPVERLTVGTLIEVPGFGAAEVYAVRFDGEGYAVDYCTDDRGGWDALDSFYVEAGGTVEFAGRGEPSLKPLTLSDVTSIVCADVLNSFGRVA